MFVVSDEMVGVFNLNGEFFALDNQCPHAGASLAHGEIEGDTVSCRIHYWRFSIRDGKYLDNGPPGKDARTIPVRVVGNQVQVKLP